MFNEVLNIRNNNNNNLKKKPKMKSNNLNLIINRMKCT